MSKVRVLSVVLPHEEFCEDVQINYERNGRECSVIMNGIPGVAPEYAKSLRARDPKKVYELVGRALHDVREPQVKAEGLTSYGRACFENSVKQYGHVYPLQGKEYGKFFEAGKTENQKLSDWDLTKDLFEDQIRVQGVAHANRDTMMYQSPYPEFAMVSYPPGTFDRIGVNDLPNVLAPELARAGGVEVDVTFNRYDAEVFVSKKELEQIDYIMSHTPDEVYDKYGLKEDEAITYTATFDDGYEMDIKAVVGYDNNYCEAVLFRNGVEVNCIAGDDDDLRGSWSLHDDDVLFVATVKELEQEKTLSGKKQESVKSVASLMLEEKTNVSKELKNSRG